MAWLVIQLFESGVCVCVFTYHLKVYDAAIVLKLSKSRYGRCLDGDQIGTLSSMMKGRWDRNGINIVS